MRDNTPTDRLEDTPDTEPFNRTQRVRVDRALISAVSEPDGPGPALLFVESQGEDMTVLRAAELTSPRLHVLQQGSAILVTGDQPQRTYDVPADLVETVAAVTGAQVHRDISLELAEDHAEQLARREALPRVLQVLPDGPDRLMLELSTGERVIWQASDTVSLIPSEMDGHRYGLSVLSFWRAPGTPAYAVPDALLPELLRHIPGADQQGD